MDLQFSFIKLHKKHQISLANLHINIKSSFTKLNEKNKSSFIKLHFVFRKTLTINVRYETMSKRE